MTWLSLFFCAGLVAFAKTERNLLFFYFILKVVLKYDNIWDIDFSYERKTDMNLKVGVIKGDGIGPEIVTEAMKVLDKVAEVYRHSIDYTQLLMGGASIDVHGVPLTDETVAQAKACDAVLMGSIGGDAKTSPWYQLEPSKRPEAGLLKIRKELNLFANLRPAILYEELKGACPLKEEITEGGFDLMIMRELTGGLYFGERKTIEEDGVITAHD